MATADDIIKVMCDHIGEANGISGEILAKKLGIEPRMLRTLTDTVIDKGISLCSHPSYGYYIAANSEELERCCQFHRSRALHELWKEAKLRRVGLADLLGQFRLKD